MSATVLYLLALQDPQTLSDLFEWRLSDGRVALHWTGPADSMSAHTTAIAVASRLGVHYQISARTGGSSRSTSSGGAPYLLTVQFSPDGLHLQRDSGAVDVSGPFDGPLAVRVSGIDPMNDWMLDLLRRPDDAAAFATRLEAVPLPRPPMPDVAAAARILLDEPVAIDEAWIEPLRSPDPTARETAQRELAARAAENPALVRALMNRAPSEEDPEVRARIEAAVAEASDDATLQCVLRFIDDPRPVWIAAWAAGDDSYRARFPESVTTPDDAWAWWESSR